VYVQYAYVLEYINSIRQKYAYFRLCEGRLGQHMFADRKEVKARKKFAGGQEVRPRDDLGVKSTKFGAEKHRIWGQDTRNLGPKHARIWGRNLAAIWYRIAPTFITISASG
jgi:hypothetical protein